MPTQAARLNLAHQMGSPRGEDVLPCMLELRWALEEAHALLAVHNPLYQKIMHMPRVQAKPVPARSCWAIYVQHLMSDSQRQVRSLAESNHLLPTAFVFDSVYVLAASREALAASFKQVAESANADHGLRLSLKSWGGSKLKEDHLSCASGATESSTGGGVLVVPSHRLTGKRSQAFIQSAKRFKNETHARPSISATLESYASRQRQRRFTCCSGYT